MGRRPAPGQTAYPTSTAEAVNTTNVTKQVNNWLVELKARIQDASSYAYGQTGLARKQSPIHQQRHDYGPEQRDCRAAVTTTGQYTGPQTIFDERL